VVTPRDHGERSRPTPRRSDVAALAITPQQVLAWTPEEADERLTQLEERVPQRPRFMEIREGEGRRAIVFGDSHGDWRSTLEPVQKFLADPVGTVLFGLGDYVDRPPDDCGAGSVANAISLLSLAADHPGRVVLIVGNHELVRRVPALPHDVPEEVDELWGPQQERYDRLMGLLERGPLAVRTANGVYLAHAGFPRGDAADWAERLARPSDETIMDVTWSDCTGSGYSRGLGTPLDEPEVRRFLARLQCRLFLRGHDPPLTGRPLFHGTVLTLHTTRVYEEYGGVIYGTFPLDRPIEGTKDVDIHHTETEGRHFAEP
jgi:hypothetical protein